MTAASDPVPQDDNAIRAFLLANGCAPGDVETKLAEFRREFPAAVTNGQDEQAAAPTNGTGTNGQDEQVAAPTNGSTTNEQAARDLEMVRADVRNGTDLAPKRTVTAPEPVYGSIEAGCDALGITPPPGSPISGATGDLRGGWQVMLDGRMVAASYFFARGTREGQVSWLDTNEPPGSPKRSASVRVLVRTGATDGDWSRNLLPAAAPPAPPVSAMLPTPSPVPQAAPTAPPAASPTPVVDPAAALRASEAFMHAKLAESGLVAADAHIQPFVFTTEAVEVGKVHLLLADSCEGAFQIGYYALDGTPLVQQFTGAPLMYRVRFKLRQGAALTPDKVGKYRGPSKVQVGAQVATMPYLPPLDRATCNVVEILHIHEGELKALCARKQAGQHAISIGGCDSWRDPTQKSAVHPDILAYLKLHAITAVVLWPDGDLQKQAVQRGWSGFAHALRRDAPQVVVQIATLPSYGPTAKFDDMVVAHGWPAVSAAVVLVAPETLRESHIDLVKRLPGVTHRPTMHKGVQVGVQVLATEVTIYALLTLHPRYAGSLWWNDDRHEPMITTSVDGRIISEPWDEGITLSQLLIDMKHHFYLDGTAPGTNLQPQVLERVAIHVARENSRSPFLEWLGGLQWDGTKRLDTWLIDFCGADDLPIVRAASALLLIAAVGRARLPGAFMRWMLVMIGAQGIGKSGVWLSLFPDEVVYLVKATQNLGKDSVLLIHKGRCAVDEEMATHTAGEHKENKAQLSVNEDSLRLPYGRTTVTLKRRSVRVGGSNDEKCLQHDPSGNNRYVPVIVRGMAAHGGRFDFAGLEAVVPQLWAEAAAREAAGEKFDVVPGADENAVRFENENAVEDEVALILCASDPGTLNAGVWLPGIMSQPETAVVRVKDICKKLRGTEYRMTQRQLEVATARALNDFGFKQVRDEANGGHTWRVDARRFGIGYEIDKLTGKRVVVRQPWLAVDGPRSPLVVALDWQKEIGTGTGAGAGEAANTTDEGDKA